VKEEEGLRKEEKWRIFLWPRSWRTRGRNLV